MVVPPADLAEALVLDKTSVCFWPVSDPPPMVTIRPEADSVYGQLTSNLFKNLARGISQIPTYG